MSPADLAEYISVLRKGNAMSAHVKLPINNNCQSVEFNIVFGPEPLPDDGVKSEPGNWKSPKNLDSNDLFESDNSVP